MIFAVLLASCLAYGAHAHVLRHHDYLSTMRARANEAAPDFLRGDGTTYGFYNPGPQVWHNFNFQPSLRCANDKRMGAWADGGKYVCDPDRFLIPEACVVLSIGSNNQWDFETSFTPYQCRTYTFDHTLDHTVGKPPNVQYFKFGLGFKNDSSVPLLSLPEIIEMINETSIDVLKIDCEGCEFAQLTNMLTRSILKNNVTQLLVEFHHKIFGKEISLQESLQSLEAAASALHEDGFRVFSKEPNTAYSGGKTCEYSLINKDRM